MVASTCLSQAERREIEAALAEAEAGTSGEIVPVVASASGRYDRAEGIFGLLCSLAALAITWIWLPDVGAAVSDWSAAPQRALGLGWAMLFSAAGFVLGSLLAAYLPILRLPFVTRREMEEEVERRAAECFYRFAIGKTKGGTGVLILVSLFEHMVVVKGDAIISAKLKPEDWQSACDLIIAGLRTGMPAKAIRDGILSCGRLLKEHFPCEPGDTNELPNKLYLVD
jgi:putative membrane protein